MPVESPGPVVRRGRAADLSGAVEALVDAFVSDPFFEWSLDRGTDARSAAVHRTRLGTWMRHAVRAAHGIGHCFVIEGDEDGECRAAALWAPPDLSFFGPERWSAVWSLVEGSNGPRSGLVGEGFALIADQHPEEPHYYLSTVGVRQRHRGAGLGSALLERVLAVCDREGVGAYLESSNPQNVGLYRRHGFRVRAELTMPEGPVVTPMWRDPR